MNFETDPRLRNIHPIKLQILKQIAQNAKGRPIDQLVPEILKINQLMKQKKLEFSQEESELLMEILMEDLSPQERQKFMMFKNMLQQ